MLRTRAGCWALKWWWVTSAVELSDLSPFFGALLQYPASNGDVFDYRDLVERFHAANALVAVGCRTGYANFADAAR